MSAHFLPTLNGTCDHGPMKVSGTCDHDPTILSGICDHDRTMGNATCDHDRTMVNATCDLAPTILNETCDDDHDADRKMVNESEPVNKWARSDHAWVKSNESETWIDYELVYDRDPLDLPQCEHESHRPKTRKVEIVETFQIQEHTSCDLKRESFNFLRAYLISS